MQLGEKLNHLDTLSVEMIHTSSLRLNVGLVFRLPCLLFHRPPRPLPFPFWCEGRPRHPSLPSFSESAILLHSWIRPCFVHLGNNKKS